MRDSMARTCSATADRFTQCRCTSKAKGSYQGTGFSRAVRCVFISWALAPVGFPHSCLVEQAFMWVPKTAFKVPAGHDSQ
jgi:hypothetical protein